MSLAATQIAQQKSVWGIYGVLGLAFKRIEGGSAADFCLSTVLTHLPRTAMHMFKSATTAVASKPPSCVLNTHQQRRRHTKTAAASDHTTIRSALTATVSSSSSSSLMPALVDADAANPQYNRSGLNGLTTGATSGLDTGCFTVTSQLPVQYTITEVHGIFDLDNKVCPLIQPPCRPSRLAAVCYVPTFVSPSLSDTDPTQRATTGRCLTAAVWYMQALLRGVVPGSFPCALGPEPEVTAGLRRFVVIDDNVLKLYGPAIRQVRDTSSAAAMACKHFELTFGCAPG